MTPNLFLCAQKAVSPHKWGQKDKTPPQSPPTIEHWSQPIPGTYSYKPGRGTYLVHIDDDVDIAHYTPSLPKGELPPLPHLVRYSRVLQRYLLECDFTQRRISAPLEGHSANVSMFRIDDGVTWVMVEDEKGRFNPGPWQRFCIDKQTKKFRPMLKGDDPVRQSKKNTPADTPSASRRSSVHGGVHAAPNIMTTRAHAEYLSARLDENAGKRSGRSTPHNSRLTPNQSRPTSLGSTPRTSEEIRSVSCRRGSADIA